MAYQFIFGGGAINLSKHFVLGISEKHDLAMNIFYIFSLILNPIRNIPPKRRENFVDVTFDKGENCFNWHGPEIQIKFSK